MPVVDGRPLVRSVPAAAVVTLLDHLDLWTPVGEASQAMLPGPQPRLTFAHLVLNRRSPVPFERLARAVWGDDAPRTWRPALRSLVARVRAFVRSATPEAAIETGPNGYHLRLPEPVWVDVEAAHARARHAEESLALGHSEDAARHAARAEELTRGSFLGNIDMGWVERVDDDIREVRLRALHVLGEVHLRRGEPERASRAATEAIELAPLREASHRLSMRALAAAGETAGAAQAFDRCRRLLGAQLGVTPSKQTTALLTAILRDT